MTREEAGLHGQLLSLLGRQADHRDVEQALLAAGWTACGVRAGLAAADARKAVGH